jgi:hypothetical protein
MMSFGLKTSLHVVAAIAVLAPCYSARAEEPPKKAQALSKEACASVCATAFAPLTIEERRIFNLCKNAFLCPALDPHLLGKSNDDTYRTFNPFPFNRWIMGDAP